jgi:ribosomal protein RSM22 (predicted rRNA methylase)
MELPAALRQAIDKALEGAAASELARDVARLSGAYRRAERPAGYHVADKGAALAYIAARLPATYAAAYAAFAAAAGRLPDFAPHTLLDIGAGPGTALWAAAGLWPSLVRADLVEGSAAMRAAGAELAAGLAIPPVWHGADIGRALPALTTADLVTAAYVLNEMSPASIGGLIDRLWALTAGLIVVVEPGTPAGYGRMLEVRERLISAGAHLVAPCPHAGACPLKSPDWCHFSRRVARSRLHRVAKGGDVPWEDERFTYIAASRTPVPASPPRVIAPANRASGHLALKLCMPSGEMAVRTLSRRDGEVYRQAKRLGWGDTAGGS